MDHIKRMGCRTAFLLIGVCFASFCTKMLHPQTPSKNAEASCKVFVQQFYDWYITVDAENEKTHEARTAMDIALGRKPGLFSNDLLQMLKEDSAAQAKADEIVGLDFDPFFNSQDPSSRFVAHRAVVNGTRCRVLVNGVEHGVVEERVEPELMNWKGEWVFVNFHYPDSKYKIDENLISILKMLRNDRRKDVK